MWVLIPSPTIDTLAKELLVIILSNFISVLFFSIIEIVCSKSFLETVYVKLILFPFSDPVWTIISTLILASLKGVNILVATPGLSNMLISVTLASSLL